MKIVYCLASISNSGGMERIVITKANCLAKLGYDVTIVTTEQNDRNSFFPLLGKIRVVNLSIYYSKDNGKNFFRKATNFVLKRRKHRKLLSNFLCSESPDITISAFGAESSFLYEISDGSRKVLEIHFSKYFRYQYGRKGIWHLVDIYRSRIDEKIVKAYDKFVVLTNEDKIYWGNLPNIEVIPNFISSIPAKRSTLTTKTCLAIGRLCYQKGFDRLIRIWKIVHEKCPDWHLQIYGSGELQDFLQNMIVSLNLEDVVSINAPISEIGNAYMDASVFLLTSHYEGLPMVLLEAMSYGLPIVSFACKCGPRDLITDGENGFLIPEGEIELFASKVIFLLENEFERDLMGGYAYREVSKYMSSNVLPLWTNLFKSVVANC